MTQAPDHPEGRADRPAADPAAPLLQVQDLRVDFPQGRGRGASS